ncbi:MAG: DUF1573 domain-containing protein [Flavobacteriales bacterium]
MKKNFFTIVLSILGWVADSAQKIEFKKETIDYGEINKGSNGERVFEFKNVGEKPLILSNVSTSCGCTIPNWSKQPIAPNQTGEISVKYDTQRLGAFHKNITIFSNVSKEGRKVLWIKGEVIE